MVPICKYMAAHAIVRKATSSYNVSPCNYRYASGLTCCPAQEAERKSRPLSLPRGSALDCRPTDGRREDAARTPASRAQRTERGSEAARGLNGGRFRTLHRTEPCDSHVCCTYSIPRYTVSSNPFSNLSRCVLLQSKIVVIRMLSFGNYGG